MKILQWFLSRFSKKSVEPEWKETPDVPTVVAPGPRLTRANAKRARRRTRNLKTRGAFGQAKVMRRDRGD